MPTLPNISNLNQSGASTTPLSVTPVAPQGNITSVGQANAPQTPVTQTPQSSGNGFGSFLASKINQARAQYPNDDNMILQGLLKDNENNPNPLIQKIKSSVGQGRVYQNNNLLAAPVPTGGTNVSTQALDQAGIKWTYGNTFAGNPKESTINILGDPIKAATAILANSPDIQTWYSTSTGKNILSEYGIKTNKDFQNASPDVQQAVIAGIKKNEAGTGGYTAKQILDQIVQDNPPASTSGANSNGQNQPNQMGLVGDLAKPLLKEGVAFSKSSGALLHLIKAAFADNQNQIPGAVPGWTEQKKELALAAQQADPTQGYNIGKFGTIKAPNPNSPADLAGTGAAAGAEGAAGYIGGTYLNQGLNKLSENILPEALQKWVPKGMLGKLIEAGIIDKTGLLQKLMKSTAPPIAP